MTLTAEQIAKREWEAMSEPDIVRVKVGVSRVGNLCLPDSNSSDKEEAVFKVLTFGDNHILDKATRYEEVLGDRRGITTITEPNEFRRLMVKKNLLDWSLDIPIERENGWMTTECYERVSRTAAPILDAFLSEFEAKSWITEDEEKTINRQSAILFSDSSRGVADACEAVSLFCTLGNYWEKFGLGRDELREIPYREYLLLKLMIGKESDATKAKSNRATNKGGTRVAGRGGRTRPSAGRRIAM